MSDRKRLFYICITSLIFIIILFSLFVSIKEVKEVKDKTCEGNVFYTISLSNYSFTFDGSILLNIRDSNEGYVYLSGVITHENNPYHISQHITINHSILEPERYLFSIKKINQIKLSDVPQNLVKSLHDIMGLSGNVPVHLYTKDENYIIWGTLMSPIMSCVILLH